MTFASRIKTLRRARKLTQQELARRADPPFYGGQISRYEHGCQPSIDAIVRLARALAVDPQELVEPVLKHAEMNVRSA